MVDGSWSMVDGMRERPILMTPENAQKCHEGTKTQTRRIIRVPSWASDDDMLKLSIQRPATGIAYYVDGMPVKRLTCPYGVVGDRLWVREAWAPCHVCPCEIYKGQGVKNCPWCDASTSGLKWTSSIHMHRFACRTVLEITEIRVERLQDISEEDALAEGVTRIDHGREYYFSAMRDEPDHRNWVDPTDAYKELWESINGKGSWGLNPWVWVISFRRVELCAR